MTAVLNRPAASKRATTQRDAAAGLQNSDETSERATPNSPASRPSTSPEATAGPAPNAVTLSGRDLPVDHDYSDAHVSRVGGDQARIKQGDHGVIAAHTASVSLFDPSLIVLAEAVDGFEDLRKASANRLRILTRNEPDSDGEERGFGLTLDHPAVAALQAQLDGIDALEHAAVLALQREFRLHPLHPWVKAQTGLGEKTVARLLASIGDPYWNTLHDRPRTVGELFAYCGVAGPGQKRKRGELCNWNATARMRLWIITGPIIRGKSRYRDVYDAGRVKYADKLHTAPCAQCGKKGQPAEVGSEWRDGHKHAGAIRLVMREVLRDLWTEAKRIHETGGAS